MIIKNMKKFRKEWIKSHKIGRELSDEKQEEIAYKIKEFFSIVHGDKSNIESFLNKEINLTGDYQIIYELMQNADDADADRLLVYYNDKYLLFVNNGKPFSESNIKAICNIGQSDKYNIQNTIGKFGIGFKLVYHLLGGVEQIMNYKAPIIFSWRDKKEIKDFLDYNGFKFGDVKHPVLFKPILTAVPVGVNEKVYDLDGNEKILFNKNEINELRKFIKEMNIEDILKNFDRGSLFFLELISKEDFEKNLNEQKSEIENSLIFLSNLSEVIINGKSFKKPEETIKHIILKENEKNNEKEIVFAYSPFNDILKNRPNFYCYFPIADEKHKLNFIINSSKFEIETSRRKLKGSGKDNINIKIIEESAELIKNEMEKRKKSIKDYEELFYAILSSDEPEDKNVKEFMYDKLMKYISENIPCKDKNNNILFKNKDKVVIKSTELDVHPKDFGIDKYWSYFENKKLEKFIKDKKLKNKKFLENYSIVNLLKDSEADFEKINEWINKKFIKDKKFVDYNCYIRFLEELIKNWSENKEFLDKIRKIKFILTESGNFVCLDDGVYFPVKEYEKLNIKKFNFINKKLLKNDKIKKFFEEKLKIEELNEKIVILEGILSKYENEISKVCYEENIRDLKYIKENLNKLKDVEKKEVLDKIKESYIIQVKDVEGYIKFSKPINAYIPKEYSGDESLEIYFTNYPANFVINDYLATNNKIERDSWFRFLKEIGCNDKPILKYKIWVCKISKYYENEYNNIIESEKKRNRFIKLEPPINNEQEIVSLIEIRLKRRLYYDEYSHHCYILCDWEIDGLENALNNIKNGKNAFKISKSIWKFLKEISLENGELEGIYHWFYRGHKIKSFKSYIYTLLRESEWLPDEDGVFRKPTELFYPLKEIMDMLGDSVNYLHSDFKIDSSSEEELAEYIGVNLDVSINNILECLKSLSGKEIEFNRIIKLYNHVYSEILTDSGILNLNKVKDYFSNYPLIYIPKTKKWRKIHEVFWEDESIVFGDTKDYLVEYYKDEEMKGFFKKIGVKVKAEIPDYINAVIDISKNVDEINDKIKKRIQKLYKKIWNDLKLDDNLWEEYRDELNKLRDGKYWLANKNGEYGFYYIDEIVINDHKHYYELFKDKVPFCEFNKEFAKKLGIESLSESIEISIKYGNKEKELKEWTNKLNEIIPEIIKFILSKNEEDEDLENCLKKLPKIKIWKINKIFAEYKIKNETANDEIESYLDSENNILYVSSDEDIPDLIGDAFEKCFSGYKINNLREFIKDLMNTKNKEKILNKWCKRGINFDINVEKYFEIPDNEEGDNISNDIDDNLNEINEEDEFKNIKEIEKSSKTDYDTTEEHNEIDEIKPDDKKDKDIIEIKDLEDSKDNHERIVYEISRFDEINRKHDDEDKLISKTDEKIEKPESLGNRKRLKNKISGEYDRKQNENWNYGNDNRNNEEDLIGDDCKKTTKIQKPRKYYGYYGDGDNKYRDLIEKLNKMLEESEPYSIDWFKKLIEIEMELSKSRYATKSLKIDFYKVKKISNHLLELSLPNKPVPQFIEDFPDIRIYDENNNQIEFSAISVDRNKVKVKIKSVSKEPKRISIEIGDLSYLLETLKERFNTLPSSNIKDEVNNKLNRIKIIYGPPGTGKTTKIVEDILKIEDLENKKILFLAPTNKAVDVFVQKIKDVAEGKIDHLKQYQDKAKELVNRKLIIRYKSTSTEKIEDLASDNINNACIVATTIAKISYDNILQKYNPNILIIDECSMIPLPHIVYTILYYDENDSLESIWISGDPNQIQPVGLFKYWREYNIYKMFNELLGINIHNITEDYRNHFGEYIKLITQYRSIKLIGELFSRYAYDGILKHHREYEKPNYLSDITNSNICVIKYDVKSEDRLKDIFKIEDSPINIYSAILATELALKIKETLEKKELSSSELALKLREILKEKKKNKKSVGIITPYKYQSHLIEGLISNQIKNKNDNIEIYASTVHKFQGEECDIIIFVLNPPNVNNISSNSLLNDKNLLNVAISRARDYLFILLPDINNSAENLSSLYSCIEQLEDNIRIINSDVLEKFLINGKTIKSISFISTHGKINIYGKNIGVKYEIKLDKISNKNLNSIDIFIN